MPKITDEQLDALQEFINIGVGRAGAMLNEMVASPIVLNVPVIQVFDGKALQEELSKQFTDHCLSAVGLKFSGSFRGSAELVFPVDSAASLVSLLTGEERDSPDLDAVKIGTLTEVGNIVINGVLGSISNLLKRRMQYTLPTYSEDTIEHLLGSNHSSELDTIFFLAQARFEIQQLEIMGEIILIFELASFDTLLNCIDAELSLISPL